MCLYRFKKYQTILLADVLKREISNLASHKHGMADRGFTRIAEIIDKRIAEYRELIKMLEGK